MSLVSSAPRLIGSEAAAGGAHRRASGFHLCANV